MSSTPTGLNQTAAFREGQLSRLDYSTITIILVIPVAARVLRGVQPFQGRTLFMSIPRVAPLRGNPGLNYFIPLG